MWLNNICRKRNRQKGFSAIESLVTMALIGAIALTTFPGFIRAQRVYRLSSERNTIQARLQYARIQALSRNTGMRIRVVNPTTYVRERNNSGSWVIDATFTMPPGFSISASANTEFHARGNANPVGTITITDPSSQTRGIVTDTSGFIHAQ